ncbi:hypothetical protein PGQ11_007773 [Apiospora arundinis]|uniref:Uncharacterized protein n=1 Tax=Apiospora arundinis TaxID=335852 RepID=A0ABR2IWG6_9PEZI
MAPLVFEQNLDLAENIIPRVQELALGVGLLSDQHLKASRLDAAEAFAFSSTTLPILLMHRPSRMEILGRFCSACSPSVSRRSPASGISKISSRMRSMTAPSGARSIRSRMVLLSHSVAYPSH